ncbi:MAG: DUF4430 domain-containing protein [Ruminococcus sp.]|nr:DUF4430 domain-containing protein [Ruminococcus sp.]
MKKDIMAIFAVVIIVIVLIMGTDFQTVEEYYLTHTEDITDDSKTVFMTIECKTILDNMEQLEPNLEEFVPENGVILKRTEYVLREGDTAFDMLERVTKSNKISMEYSGSDSNQYGTAYIEGINYLYEFSCGELSGWMYSVNGEFPRYGCSAYKLKDGDEIVWSYTCDLGRDVGCEWEGTYE